MSSAPPEEALSRAFDRAVVEHFGSAAQADAEEVMVAGCTVVGKHIAGVRDPVSRGVLLAQALWTLRRVVDGLVQAATARSLPATSGYRRRCSR